MSLKELFSFITSTNVELNSAKRRLNEDENLFITRNLIYYSLIFMGIMFGLYAFIEPFIFEVG